MNARFFRPAGRGTPRSAAVHDDTIQDRRAVPAGSACCCPARPVVQVVMPPTATRRRPTELLLCGHHYRSSREALAAANATVTELPGISGSPLAALVADLHEPSLRVS